MMANADIIEEQYSFWLSLFKRAFIKTPFDTLCTLLRPSGMHDAGWDVLDESKDAFDDFNWMIAQARNHKSEACSRRLALHFYCLLIEMSASHELIINLLRCLAGQNYLPLPFAALNRRKKTGIPWEIVPASMPAKLKFITDSAGAIGESLLVERLEYAFNEPLRNAIAHADYILLPNELRYFNAGSAQRMALIKIDQLIDFAFAFIGGLIKAQTHMKYILKDAKRFHKWDNYEVLEILSNKNGVYGFHVHFSNGSKATYSRDLSGATMINIRPAESLEFMVGIIDELEPVWKVNGIPVTDWDELNKR